MPNPLARLSPCQLAEYTELYARRARLLEAYADAVAGGIQSATVATAGNSQSYTRMSPDAMLAAIRAITARMRQLLGLPPAGATISLPSFAP